MSVTERKLYKAYTLGNYRTIPQIQNLSEDEKFVMDVVGNVLPFKVNNYVIDELINWDRYREDPMFILTFPQQDMLLPHHFEQMAAVLKQTDDKSKIKEAADLIRMELNPHPAGQQQLNVPMIEDMKLTGMQHKYKQTVLFFPSQGQTCHAYCTFCFRWPQFVGMDELKFAMREGDFLLKYIQEHEEVTDILFTGGDPMVMKPALLESYIQPILDANIPHLQTIRFGTKSLSYWPYKYTTDPDAEDMLRLFEKISASGIHVAIMGHFNHSAELKTDALKQAVQNIRNTGAQIRTQSPLLRHINADPEIWATMWKNQVSLGMIPYYMFVVRDTGAQHFFGVPLVEAWQIFQKAYQSVSGICRTARGPSMSCTPGKVQILGPVEVNGELTLGLRMLQGRNPDWVDRPFFAKYDETAIWLDDLKPAFGDKFFFEDELEGLYHEHIDDSEALNFE